MDIEKLEAHIRADQEVKRLKGKLDRLKGLVALGTLSVSSPSPGGDSMLQVRFSDRVDAERLQEMLEELVDAYGELPSK